MIRFADHSIKDQLKTLWKDAFSDCDEFIELYFEQKYKPHNTLVKTVNNKVLSTLQMLDYKMSFYGYDVGTSYISGAATQKNQRGNGLMRLLLCKSFEIMYNKQQLFSILIPGEHIGFMDFMLNSVMRNVFIWTSR
jgi:predicted acetyltransferase